MRDVRTMRDVHTRIWCGGGIWFSFFAVPSDEGNAKNGNQRVTFFHVKISANCYPPRFLIWVDFFFTFLVFHFGCDIRREKI